MDRVLALYLLIASSSPLSEDGGQVKSYRATPNQPDKVLGQ